ncbi:MAG TPA: porin family protein [Caulobacteraceae bacterium]|jgi:opacity protein-like surface antigen
MKIMLSAAAAAAALFAAGAASAQVAPLYGSIGYTHYGAEVDGEELDLGAITGRIGTRFHPNFAVEGEGSFGVRDHEESAGGLTLSVGLNHQVIGYAVGFLPVSPAAELFARIGYGVTDIEAEITGPGFSGSESESEGTLALGAGGQFFFDGVNGVRAEYTRFDFQDGGDIDSVAISYVRRF